jgi:hypothetical protein
VDIYSPGAPVSPFWQLCGLYVKLHGKYDTCKRRNTQRGVRFFNQDSFFQDRRRRTVNGVTPTSFGCWNPRTEVLLYIAFLGSSRFDKHDEKLAILLIFHCLLFSQSAKFKLLGGLLDTGIAGRALKAF